MEQAVRISADERPIEPASMRLMEIRFISGSNISNHATVIVEIDGERKVFVGEGNGPIDALRNALHPIAPDFQVTLYNVKYIREGSGAEAKADVTIGYQTMVFSGSGRDINTDVAGGRAVIAALNLVRYHQAKNTRMNSTAV